MYGRVSSFGFDSVHERHVRYPLEGPRSLGVLALAKTRLANSVSTSIRGDRNLSPKQIRTRDKVAPPGPLKFVQKRRGKRRRRLRPTFLALRSSFSAWKRRFPFWNTRWNRSPYENFSLETSIIRNEKKNVSTCKTARIERYLSAKKNEIKFLKIYIFYIFSIAVWVAE